MDHCFYFQIDCQIVYLDETLTDFYESLTWVCFAYYWSIVNAVSFIQETEAFCVLSKNENQQWYYSDGNSLRCADECATLLASLLFLFFRFNLLLTFIVYFDSRCLCAPFLLLVCPIFSAISWQSKINIYPTFKLNYLASRIPLKSILIGSVSKAGQMSCK